MTNVKESEASPMITFSPYYILSDSHHLAEELWAFGNDSGKSLLLRLRSLRPLAGRQPQATLVTSTDATECTQDCGL